MTDIAILNDIQRRDPDGGSVEPTEADYRRFRDYVIDAYGSRAWHDYSQGDWMPESEV